MTYGNGPQMAAIIAAAEGGQHEPTPDDERTGGATYGYGAEIEPHEPFAISDRILCWHAERMTAW